MKKLKPSRCIRNRLDMATTCTTTTAPKLRYSTHHKIFLKDSQKMPEVESNSIQLVVTSPPYWNIKDYGHPDQIGYRDSLDDYLTKLGNVWTECIRVLQPGCRLCINIGDQYLRASDKEPYHIVPLHAHLVNSILLEHKKEMFYLGSIIWKKISNTKTSGGASVMGSYGYPRNGYVSYNYEYIAIFKKKGIAPKPASEIRQKASIGLREWRKLFTGIWHFNGARQIGHVAIFPDELPKRLMQMFTYENDTVLDPFLGSGTTTRVAYKLGRNSFGYEIGFKSPNISDTIETIKEKIYYYQTPIKKRKDVFPTFS
jgi:modification methylase